MKPFCALAATGFLIVTLATGQVSSKEPGYGKAVRSGSVSRSAEVAGPRKSANVRPPVSSNKSAQQQLNQMEKQSATHARHAHVQAKATPPAAKVDKPGSSDNKNVAMNFNYQPRKGGMKANGPPNSSKSARSTTRPIGH